ncbi:MAG: ferritin family protein [Deltaproteobacteria bacterium]|nr:ferritin family protein [Deltaproteobacteria bacterium]
MTKDALFRASEMLDMAVRIEHQGLKFYEACQASQADPEVKEVFKYLMDQEKAHARVFSHMREELREDYTLPESYPGEMRNYLDAFVKGEVFEDPGQAGEKGSEMKDPVEAVDFGLEIEKASILFYSGMKQYVRASEVRNVDRIIAEEQQHVKRLLSLRKKMEA